MARGVEIVVNFNKLLQIAALINYAFQPISAGLLEVSLFSCNNMKFVVNVCSKKVSIMLLGVDNEVVTGEMLICHTLLIITFFVPGRDYVLVPGRDYVCFFH